MEQYKKDFIEFMVASDVLRFGDFTTKSGRKTPFFINTGAYRTGSQVVRLGRFYAEALRAGVGDNVDMLFGPAYKGIPLVVATAMTMAQDFGRDLPFAFNRKEIKDHGEGGMIVGHVPCDGERVVIVEDVITAGTSVRQTIALFGSLARVQFTGLILSVDRMERGTSNRSAVEEIREEFGIPVFPIVNLDEIVGHLHNRAINGRVVLDDAIKARIDEYRSRYGV